MKTLLLLLVAFTLAGCEKTPETSSHAGVDFVVEKLFTHEGCTVYRFRDSGNKRYFTNCSGSTNWTESCGENCTRPIGIN